MNQRDEGVCTMESIRPSGDRTHFAVRALRPPIGESGRDVGDDAVDVFGNRPCDLREGLDARVRRPGVPFPELGFYDVRLSAVEDGEIAAPESLFYGFGDCQERLNKLLSSRATLKTSVETGLQVANKLTELVGELKGYRVE